MAIKKASIVIKKKEIDFGLIGLLFTLFIMIFLFSIAFSKILLPNANIYEIVIIVFSAHLPYLLLILLLSSEDIYRETTKRIPIEIEEK